jgi:all-trans-retinol 13,14-reductase
MKYDYVIIGAGVSGMTAALILAKDGFDVALVEKSRKTAPLIRGFRRNGTYFDTGFHHTGSLGNNEILDILFHYLGLSDRLEKEPFDPDGFDLLRCGQTGFEFRFPYGYERIQDRLLEKFPGEAKAINEYLTTVKDTFNSFPYINLDPEGLEMSIQKSVRGPSLKEFLDRLTDNQQLKWVLSLHCLLHGVPPEEVPFTYNACVAGSYYESVHRIKGGGACLAKAYDSRLKELSVDVYCGQAASKIRVPSDPSSISEVRLQDGTSLQCRGCISTIHPKNFLNLVPESTFRPAYRKRLQQLEETCSAYILYAGCNTLPQSITRNNLLLTSDWDLTGLRQKDPLENRPLYVCQAHQPNGKALNNGLIAIVPAPGRHTERWSDSNPRKRPKDYIEFKDNTGKRLQRHVEACVPEMAGNIQFAECSTPLTIRDFTNNPFGSIYGVKHKVGQYNPIPVTKVKSLFLAGQATVASGILGTAISAFLACGFILGHQKLIKQIQKYK